MDIALTTHTFINLWGREMPTVYVVSLTVPDADAGALVAVCARLEQNDPRWAQSARAAQSALGLTITSTEGHTTIRWLLQSTQYPDFKTALRAAKAAEFPPSPQPEGERSTP